MRRLAPYLATCVSVLALLLAGCSPGDTTTSAAEAPDTGPSTTEAPGRSGVAPLTWGACDDADPPLECATLSVPLDHDEPEGPTIDVALIRVAADGERDGVVLINPGGPGASGYDAVRRVGTVMHEGGYRSVDLIGFDPRGVDRSAGVRCIEDSDRYLSAVFGYDAPDDVNSFANQMSDACLESAESDDLVHYSTTATARDMDLIRAALGEEQISYLGISYGTYLGAVYASLFPDRVDAFLLDSAYDPTGDRADEITRRQLIGFEEAFDTWVAHCESDPSCAFHAPDVGERWAQLRSRLADDPVPAADGRLANHRVMETATIMALYSDTLWEPLAVALDALDGGDAEPALGLAESYAGRTESGTFSTMLQSHHVISCASGFMSNQPDDPETAAAAIREAAPTFGGAVTALSFGQRCEDIAPDAEMAPISFDGDGHIVVIGGLNDPATPYDWAVSLSERLGPNAVLVTWDGEGHGRSLESSCLYGLGLDLILDGVTPADGTVCKPE